MSMDFTSSPQSGDQPSETPMFAPRPIWERSKKKRGFGRSRAAPAATAASAGPAVAASTDPDDTVLTSPMEHPMPYTGRTTTRTRKSGGVSPLAIGAGIVAIGALAFAGWYATQPRSNTIAQLTPGAPGEAALSGSPQASTVAATTPAAPAPKTTVTARNAAPAPAARSTTTTRVAAASRVRPATRSPAATGQSIDASGTAALPAGPQPYSATTSGANAATTVNPAPAPAIPATPPVEPAPQPSASSATPATPAPETPAQPETTPPQ